MVQPPPLEKIGPSSMIIQAKL